jgi:type II secretory pathway pseudopilin PulG
MKKNGFTLLEVVLAVFMLSTSAFASFSLIQSTIVSASLNKQKLTAYYSAQESLEVIRNIRDGNWLKQRDDEEILWTDGIVTEGCISPRPTICDSYGDINRDGVVTGDDEDMIAYLIFGGGDEDQRERADVNGDGLINALDITTISNFVACVTNTFPVCSTKAVFQKEITITQLSGDLLEISAKISWQDRGKNQEIEVISQLSNWR